MSDSRSNARADDGGGTEKVAAIALWVIVSVALGYGIVATLGRVVQLFG